ncbi:hypothetical protein Tco_0771692 [Tanacetum coccineum]|uniref:Uncharacterized protein n=1 Tax=Tanacetum coccineum TaxID=301880 RepID=A0ABQ4ZID6_9ASTR
MPSHPRPGIGDLYDRMGRMEIHQGELERMSRRQLYHTDRYAGVFEFMAGHYGVPLQGAYVPPGYDEQQEDQEYCRDDTESLESVYERLSTLVNVIDHNDVRSIKVSINTKFLNSLQPEWSKYVTLTRQNKDLSDVEYDSPSYSHLPQTYYVTHPSSVVDSEEDYQRESQGDAQKDKHSTALMNTVSKVPNINDTIRFKLDSQEIVYTVDIFRSTLNLPVETTKNPFIEPATMKFIQPFMQIVGYQGVVDKIFHVVVNHVHVDYVALIWWDFLNCVLQKKDVIQLEEDYHSIKDDIPLASLYSIENVIVQGILISDEFITDDIRSTEEYKEYMNVFVRGFAAVLAVLVTGASQSRQHGKSESDSYYLSD